MLDKEQAKAIAADISMATLKILIDGLEGMAAQAHYEKVTSHHNPLNVGKYDGVMAAKEYLISCFNEVRAEFPVKRT